MTPTRQGSFRLFQFAGIEVFLHWSWFLVAAYEVTSRKDYSSYLWNGLEYAFLFGIVLLHEFGHALACRQVGGRADQIVLWPLGGVAYVAPPQRAGATLWSIAAGPLVNVVLLPILLLAWAAASHLGWPQAAPDAYHFVKAMLIINTGLLVFNLLPIYPLDGGQILRSLLWFMLGRARSLLVASLAGFVGVALLILLAVWAESVWFGILSVFILMNCWGGLQQARALARLEDGPRHAGFACPACRAAPVQGAFWVCGRCQARFDSFATGAMCPQCGAQFSVTHCLLCGSARPIAEWAAAPPLPPG